MNDGSGGYAFFDAGFLGAGFAVFFAGATAVAGATFAIILPL